MCLLVDYAAPLLLPGFRMAFRKYSTNKIKGYNANELPKQYMRYKLVCKHNFT